MNKHICNNCSNHGHLFNQCKSPITSYGIITFRKSIEHGLQFLMIRRKNSFGFIDFIRGKYNTNNLPHLLIMFNEMSIEEKELIRNNNFNTLWKHMWGNQEHGFLKNEELISQKKFESLRNGICIDDKTINIDSLILYSTTEWTETEWEFPKGRKQSQEKELDCALREFQEETGLSNKHIHIIDNILPFEEMFLGSNHKSYKNKYFLAYTEHNYDNLHNFQQSEVSKIEWKTLDDCLETIRPYNLEKKQLIININKLLLEYRLY